MGLTATLAMAAYGAATGVAILNNIYHRVKTRKERPKRTFKEKAKAFAMTTFVALPLTVALTVSDSIIASFGPDEDYGEARHVRAITAAVVVGLCLWLKPMCLLTGIIIHTSICLGMSLGVWDNLYLDNLQDHEEDENE